MVFKHFSIQIGLRVTLLTLVLVAWTMLFVVPEKVDESPRVTATDVHTAEAQADRMSHSAGVAPAAVHTDDLSLAVFWVCLGLGFLLVLMALETSQSTQTSPEFFDQSRLAEPRLANQQQHLANRGDSRNAQQVHLARGYDSGFNDGSVFHDFVCFPWLFR